MLDAMSERNGMCVPEEHLPQSRPMLCLRQKTQGNRQPAVLSLFEQRGRQKRCQLLPEAEGTV